MGMFPLPKTGGTPQHLPATAVPLPGQDTEEGILSHSILWAPTAPPAQLYTGGDSK